MAGIRALNGVHRQSADRVDAQFVPLLSRGLSLATLASGTH
jgi:hypothetical protein